MNFTQTFVFSHSTNLNTPWISRRPESIRSQFLVLAGINHGSIATGLYYILSDLRKINSLPPLKKEILTKLLTQGFLNFTKWTYREDVIDLYCKKKEQEEGLLFELMIILNNAFLMPEYS
tara:strand:- start:1058 stop:1417 length:360 start_codon:yes stop_codon:yes gene_type:complete